MPPQVCNQPWIDQTPARLTDKVSVKILCFALLVAMSIQAADRASEDLLVTGGGREHSRSAKRTWIRRATLIAGCAASLAFDTLTTRRAVAAGAVETNGILAGSAGQPQWGRVIGLKAAFCGISTAFEETHAFGMWKTPASDWTWTAVNAGTASVYTWAGFHNLKLRNELSTVVPTR